MTISLNKMKSKYGYGAKRKSAIETLKNKKQVVLIPTGQFKAASIIYSTQFLPF